MTNAQMPLRLSVVMATYQGDLPGQLQAAGESVFAQTRAPDELVVVCDGPITEAHEQAIAAFAQHGNVRIVRLAQSLGPGGARHQGILAAAHDIVAVMDADDLCVSTRFERQLQLLETDAADVVGGWIREFDNEPGESGTVRKVPEQHEDIWRYAKRRSPMNNVTAMMRRPHYLAAGGYASLRTFEDYDLYVRMLMRGSRFRNIPSVLVAVRAGRDMFKRRGGMWYIPIELRLLHGMYRSGFFTTAEFVSNCAIRTTVRLMPNWARRIAYTHVLRR